MMLAVEKMTDNKTLLLQWYKESWDHQRDAFLFLMLWITIKSMKVCLPMWCISFGACCIALCLERIWRLEALETYFIGQVVISRSSKTYGVCWSCDGDVIYLYTFPKGVLKLGFSTKNQLPYSFFSFGSWCILKLHRYSAASTKKWWGWELVTGR